jgi:hypothetical protein
MNADYLVNGAALRGNIRPVMVNKSLNAGVPGLLPGPERRPFGRLLAGQDRAPCEKGVFFGLQRLPEAPRAAPFINADDLLL